MPNSAKSPDELMLYLAESVVVLAGVVDKLVEANKLRPRGRPPKER